MRPGPSRIRSQCPSRRFYAESHALAYAAVLVLVLMALWLPDALWLGWSLNNLPWPR